MSLIKGDSLLSNISNISVLIKPGDGSSIFNFSMLGNCEGEADQHQKNYEIKLDEIEHDQYNLQDNNNSMLDPIMKKEDNGYGSALQYYTSPILPQFVYNVTTNFGRMWTTTKHEGISEEENSRSEDEDEEKHENQDELKRMKNQTKNIPKNYGKAIISFIEKYPSIIAQVCEYTDVPYDIFIQQMFQTKKTINTIADLRRLWMDYKYSRCMRIVSNIFLRKYSFNYIFNSRICNYRSHIKYRHRLCQAIQNPNAFRHIKDY